MITEAEPNIIYSFEKPPRDKWHSREEVRASLQTYQGRSVLDIRAFYRDAKGQSRPTPRGLCLPVTSLPELEATVVALRKAVDGAGLEPLRIGRTA